MKHTCIIVDDLYEARERLAQLLFSFEDLEILSKEGIPETAVQKIIKLKPDLLFLDVEMPRMSGFDLLEKINKANVFPAVIFTTAFDHYAIKAIKNKALDYLLKPIDVDELKASINRFKIEKMASKLTYPKFSPPLECLSKREKEVLQLLIQGKTSQQIADELFISKTTVDTHRQHLLEKTGFKNTAELVVWGVGHAL